MKKVILTGGTGLVGTRLTQLLQKKGYGVNILCRNPGKDGEFKWNIEKGYIDEGVFEDAVAIIHLAGANVAEKRWTDARKKEIIESRTKSVQLLHDYLSRGKHAITAFLSASAVGYYGDRGNELLTEEAENGTGFLAEVCRLWESEADNISALNIAVSKIRIGIVMSKEGGAMPKLSLPVRFGIGAYIGDGRQYVPWIHIDDLCRMFIYLLEHPSLQGVYNGCAPDVKTNKETIETIAEVLHRPILPVPAPGFILKTVMGEMATMLLMSNHCSSQKIQKSGFEFQYPSLLQALSAIYNRD